MKNDLSYSCQIALIISLVKCQAIGLSVFDLESQASPIVIGGREVVVEEKRSTNSRGKLDLILTL